MDGDKRTFNHRAFVAMMTALMGICLPVSGLILHAYSHNRIVAGRHAWVMMHIVAGTLFLVFAVWHIILNRRPLLRYITSSAAGSLPLSREAGLAILIAVALIVLIISHSE
jgi:hypothetical protein